MKKYIKILLTIVSAGLMTFGAQSVTYAQYDNGYDNSSDDSYDNYDNQNYNDQGGQQMDVNDFYDQLSPYGRWVDEPSYGRVWVANVSNFQPYATNGYWTYTNYGWTWVSNYDWGWAPFHYGRWGHSSRNGWFWVPGSEWGPAWVSWSSASDMYGWAPLGPGMNFGVNISIGSFPANYWTFMPRRYMGYHNQNNYYVDRSRYTTIIRNTRIINNYGGNGRRYSMGPQRREVERSTGRTVRATRVVNSRSSKATGVRNNELHMYRPTVKGRTNSKETPARRATPSRSTTQRSSNSSNVQRKTPTRSQVTPSARQRAEQATRQKAAQQRQQSTRQSQANAKSQARTQVRTQAAQQRAAQQQATRQRQQAARTQKAQQAQQSRQRAQQAKQAQQQARQQQRTQRKQQASPARSSAPKVQRSAPSRTQQSAPARSSAPTRSSSGRASRGR